MSSGVFDGVVKKLTLGRAIIFSLAIKTDTQKKRAINYTKFSETVMF
jgi:hypothetical protein